MSQAYITAFNKYGSPDEWVWSPQTYPIPQTLAGYLIENLKVAKVCDDGTCFPDVIYKRLNGTNHTNYHNFGSQAASFVLSDGTVILFWSSGSCSAINKTCGFIYTDINGKIRQINGAGICLVLSFLQLILYLSGLKVTSILSKRPATKAVIHI